jgi:hypothetical protein
MGDQVGMFSLVHLDCIFGLSIVPHIWCLCVMYFLFAGSLHVSVAQAPMSAS